MTVCGGSNRVAPTDDTGLWFRTGIREGAALSDGPFFK